MRLVKVPRYTLFNIHIFRTNDTFDTARRKHFTLNDYHRANECVWHKWTFASVICLNTMISCYATERTRTFVERIFSKYPLVYSCELYCVEARVSILNRDMDDHEAQCIDADKRTHYETIDGPKCETFIGENTNDTCTTERGVCLLAIGATALYLACQFIVIQHRHYWENA